MRTTKTEIVSYLLTPFSWMYGAVTSVRNKCFDWGILPQKEYDVPIVSVGNITVGGTGKTPTVEYIVRSFAGMKKIAVLSRGYRRRTKGFILANNRSTPDTIGDEPYQIYQKYGKFAKVAVCESRRKGVEKLLELYPDLELIVLDDAFQHRYVRPKISVMLMDYSHPVYDDFVLPLGRLRESPIAMNRADMVVVTKCPEDMSPLDFRLVKNKLELMKFQKLYFSTVEYGMPEPVFPDDDPYAVNLGSLTRKDTALLLTGIANPRGFIRHFKQYDFRRKVAHFPDHHDFSRRDVERLEETFEKMKGKHKVILTTEKDATRLVNNPYFPQHLKKVTFYVPISVRMLAGVDDNDFVRDLENELFK